MKPQRTASETQQQVAVFAEFRADTRERAVMMFGKLRVWDTAHNNGVLIYRMLAEHAIELVEHFPAMDAAGTPQDNPNGLPDAPVLG